MSGCVNGVWREGRHASKALITTGWLACRAGKQESPPDRDQGHADVGGKLYADTLLPRLLPSTKTSHTTRLRSAPHVVKFDAVGCLTRRCLASLLPGRVKRGV